MKKTLPLILCLLFALAAGAQNLFVGSYNIRNNSNNGDVEKGNGWSQRLPVICGQILFEQPDIFGTQEVLHQQVKDLKRNLPDYDYVGVGRDDGKEAGEYECIWYNTTKLNLLDKGNFWLSETPDRPGLGWDAVCVRICSWGKFEVKCHSGRKCCKGETEPFFFFNLHMDHVGVVARREAAKLVVRKISEICQGAPVIVTGDFNVDQNNEIYTIFTESGLLKDSYVAAKQRFAENGTFNSFDTSLKTDSRIDHIFVSPATDIEHYAIMTNGYWTELPEAEQQKGNDAPGEISFQRQLMRPASDHYPVWAKIRLSNKNQIAERGFLYDTPVPATCHAVTMVETANGDMLAAFFGGTCEGHPDSSIWLCRLKKGSHTWSAPELLTEAVNCPALIKAFDYEKPMKDRKPCYNPVLYKAQNGDIVLDYKIGSNMQDWTGWEMRSSDGGQTWTTPRPLTTKAKERHLRLGPIKNKPFVNNGRIIAGSSTEVTYESWMVHFETSDDDGKTWKKREVKCDTILCIQPSILDLGNNHLKALCRTRQNHISVTESFDNGTTWTDMKFCDLPNNDSGLDAVTLRDGSHLLICNDSGINGKRSPLTLFHSKDAEHWTKVMDLEEDDGKEYSYPAIIQTSDGDVWVMYTWHRQKIAWVHLKL